MKMLVHPNNKVIFYINFIKFPKLLPITLTFGTVFEDNFRTPCNEPIKIVNYFHNYIGPDSIFRCESCLCRFHLDKLLS
jgi:hypothetical protein